VYQFNGRLGQIPQWHRFFPELICQSCSHYSSYIPWVELWYLNQQTGFQFAGVPRPLRVNQTIRFLSIWGALDPRIAKQFGIFTESSILNNLQWIPQGNRYQHLDSTETDPALYICNYPGIERLFKRNQVGVSYPKIHLVYSWLTRSIQLSIVSISNEVQVHLRSTLLTSLMISHLTPHVYSIQRLVSTGRHSLFTYYPTSGKPLNCIYPLHITFEVFILLNASNLWLPAQRVSSVRHWTFRCKRGSSCSAPANIWIDAWSVC